VCVPPMWLRAPLPSPGHAHTHQFNQIQRTNVVSLTRALRHHHTALAVYVACALR
jgi:hypothetical protein